MAPSSSKLLFGRWGGWWCTLSVVSVSHSTHCYLNCQLIAGLPWCVCVCVFDEYLFIYLLCFALFACLIDWLMGWFDCLCVCDVDETIQNQLSATICSNIRSLFNLLFASWFCCRQNFLIRLVGDRSFCTCTLLISLSISFSRCCSLDFARFPFLSYPSSSFCGLTVTLIHLLFSCSSHLHLHSRSRQDD